MEGRTIIGIGQMKVSSDSSETLVAPNLGSCLGIAVFDPTSKIAGMIHCLLPLSKSDPEKAKANPCLYVDTGVAMLLDQMLHKGANRKTLVIAVAGGGNINDQNNLFEIGVKNYTVFKKILWKNNLLLRAEHVGQSFSRTVILHVANGKTTVKVNNGETFDLT